MHVQRPRQALWSTFCANRIISCETENFYCAAPMQQAKGPLHQNSKPDPLLSQAYTVICQVHPANTYVHCAGKFNAVVGENLSLKGQCHKIFCSGFLWIFSPPPPAPENNSSVILKFLKILGDIRKWRCTIGINDTGGKFCHRYRWCRWYWWQIMGTISDCLHLKVNLKEEVYLHVNSTNQRYPNKIIKTFLIEDFFHLPPVLTILGVHLELWISMNFLKHLKRP